MPRPSPLPAALGPEFSTREAGDVGVTRRRLRAQDLVAPFHGVRAIGEPTISLEQRARAYLRVMGSRQVFSHATAALLHEIPLPWRLQRDERLHVTALDGIRAPRGVGVVGHRTTASVHIRMFRGLRVLSPADTWCSLATMLGLDDLICAGDRVLGLPWPLASADEVERAIERHGRRAGATTMRDALTEMRSGSFSPRETMTRLVLVRAGLPMPELNSPIWLRSGRTTRGDLVFRPWRVLVEYDGEQHATDLAQWRTDVDRLNDFTQDDWRVIRVTKRTSPDELVARTRLALHERGWRP
jgi:hypothetical protein